MLTNVWQRHFNLLMLAVIVLGLAAGAAVATVTKSTPPAVTALPATGFSGATTNGGNAATQRQGGTGQTASGPTTRPLMGSVKSVAADSVTVQGQQGDSTVKLADAKIAKLVDGSADDLKSGQQVSVTAQQEADGSYTATGIQLVQADQSGPAALAQGGFAGQSSGSAGGQSGARGQGQNQGQGGAASNGQSRTQGQGQSQGQTGSDTRARPIVGTISSFSGGVLTVTTQQGEDKIKLGSARIQKSAEGSAKDLQEGQRVLVTGQQGSDGSYSSAQIQILASQQ